MKKSTINLIIDAVLLVLLAAMAGIGFLIKYVLVPGYARWEIYGRNVDLFFRGMDRHQWGTVHLVIGVVFLALMVLHVVLHWDMITAIYRCMIPNRLLRRTVAVVFAMVVLFAGVFALLVKPEVSTRGFGPGRGQGGRGCQEACCPSSGQTAEVPQVN